MSLDAVYHEQQAHRCACPRLSSRECIRARHPGLYRDPWDEDRDPYEDDERCECSCHGAEFDDEEDWDP